uniref:HSP70h n=1 Tax=Olivavirus actinidiae TaxID=2024724 RepID=A0A7L9CBW0_9CLOS|nr:HSP70h [Actinidia virus 1]UIW14045.1 MAG: heat shock protein 70-like protein [Actinidia virus 1]UIW14055.1 MAG: heat shock protein 70-like protein [Actinidia virus 1]
MTIIGIDYGTTFSTCSIVTSTSVLILQHNDSEYIPSLIAISNKTGAVTIGLDVTSKELDTSYSCYKDMKRWVGVDTSSYTERELKLKPTYDTKPHVDMYDFELGAYNVKGRLMPIRSLISLYIKALVKLFEVRCSVVCSGLVLSVPSQYTTSQRSFMVALASAIGIKIIHIMNEPSAALFASVSSIPNKVDSEYYIVYDFGGGTFDVSIVGRETNYYAVILSGGDDALGGRDVDRAIKTFLENRFSVKLSDSDVSQLKEQVSRNGNNQSVTVSDTNVSLTYSDLINIIRPFLDRAGRVLADVYRDSGLQGDITLVPIGGSALLPGIIASAKMYLEKIGTELVYPRLRTAVSEGCSLVSATVGTPGYLFVDCITSTISGVTGFFCVTPLIPRGSPLPCTATRSYKTSSNYNVRYLIAYFEGDSIREFNNKLITRFRIDRKVLGINVNAPWSFSSKISVSPLGLLTVEIVSGMSSLVINKSAHVPVFNELPCDLEHAIVPKKQLSSVALADYNISQSITKVPKIKSVDNITAYLRYLRETQGCEFSEVEFKHYYGSNEQITGKAGMEVRRPIPIFFREEGYSIYPR